MEEEREQRITPYLPTKRPRIVTKSEAIPSEELPKSVQILEKEKVILNESITNDADLPSPEINQAKESKSEIALEEKNEVTLPISEEADDSKTVTDVATNLHCSIAVGLYKEDQNL